MFKFFISSIAKCLHRCHKWDFYGGGGESRTLLTVQLCICVLTGECAMFRMNGKAGLNDFQISWNRWKGHSWTTLHSNIKAMFKWSSLPLTDTVNQAGDFSVNQQPVFLKINKKPSIVRQWLEFILSTFRVSSTLSDSVFHWKHNSCRYFQDNNDTDLALRTQMLQHYYCSSESISFLRYICMSIQQGTSLEANQEILKTPKLLKRLTKTVRKATEGRQNHVVSKIQEWCKAK